MYVRDSRPRFGPFIGSLLLGLAVGAVFAGVGPATAAAGPTEPPERGPLFLEDPIETLVPKQSRTEADQDRVEALSLFSAARMHEQRREYAEALRLYQRALRCDPTALPVVQAIVPLAIRLNREQEALAYILKAVELEPPDPVQLEQVGTFLYQNGDVEGAARYYERALAATGGSGEPSIDVVRLRLVLGKFYVALEEYGKAADAFAQTIDALDHPEEHGLDDADRTQLLGEPGRTYNLFGETFLSADRLDDAAAAFEKANELAPNEGLVEFSRARVLARRNEPDKALAALEACFKNPPDNQGTAPFDLLAEVLGALDKKAELTERLQKVAADNPENLTAQYALAEQYRKSQDIEKAEPIYRAMLDKTFTETGYRRLAQVYREAKRPEALLDLLAEVLEKTGVIETLGPEIEAIAGDAETMRSLVEVARTRYKTEPKESGYFARYAVALLALEAEQMDAAGEFMELALEADPKRARDVLLVWGLGLLLADKPADSVEVFRRAIGHPALADELPRLYYLLSGALVMDEQIDEALTAAKKAAELQADSPVLLNRVAWILYRARRYDDAIAAYRGLIEKFDADHSSLDTRDVLREARLILSNLCVIKGDLPEAEEWLEQVLDEAPDDVGASNDLGYLWADQGRHLQRALRMIQHAVDAEPDNAAYIDSLGWVYYRLERYDEAVAELKKAVAADEEPDGVILDHLGDALWKVNQADDARKAWQRAAEAFAKREEPEKAKAAEKKIEKKSDESIDENIEKKSETNP